MLLIPSIATATTIILDDGTVVETTKNVYVSDEPLFSLTEAVPLVAGSGGDEEPSPQGSPEWCDWYVDNYGVEITLSDGTVIKAPEPSFDPRYDVFARDC